MAKKRIEGAVPKLIDPFKGALDLLKEVIALSKKSWQPPKRTIYFGAPRGGRSHNGIDLMVDRETPIQVPAPKIVLIGKCKDNVGPGKTIGNGLVFFVPNKDQPFFLLLAHLSKNTFKLLDKKGLGIGSVIERKPYENFVVAFSGASKAGPAPHVHVSVTTSFMLGGTIYRAGDFLAKYNEGSLPGYLRGRNLNATKPAQRIKNPKSLKGYHDPLAFIEKNKLRFAALPEPIAIAEREKRKPLAAIR